MARSEAGPEGDVDAAVPPPEGAPPDLQRADLRIEGELERRVVRQVQAVVTNPARVDLVHRVLRDCVLLSESDRRARIRFEVRARNECFDLLPFLRRHRRLEDWRA